MFHLDLSSDRTWRCPKVPFFLYEMYLNIFFFERAQCINNTLVFLFLNTCTLEEEKVGSWRIGSPFAYICVLGTKFVFSLPLHCICVMFSILFSVGSWRIGSPFASSEEAVCVCVCLCVCVCAHVSTYP